MILNASAFSLPLKDESVHEICTSPPYWGLRKYSGLSPMVFGGDKKCEHDFAISEIQVEGGHGGGIESSGLGASRESLLKRNKGTEGKIKQGFCPCGAWLGDFGLEPTLDCGRTGKFKLRADLTEAQKAFVIQRLLGVGGV